MSTTTLSQRLRELSDEFDLLNTMEDAVRCNPTYQPSIQTAGEQSKRVEALLEKAIAQAQAQEAQAPVAEVYDVFMGGPMPSGSPKEHAWEARGMNGNWWCLNCGVCGGNSTAPANVGPCADRGPSDTCSGEPSQAIGKQTPVAWIYEDSLPEGYPYDLMFPYSEVRDFVRMFPVYGPSPLSPEARDRAIEALESIGKDAREIFDHGASLLTVKAGSGRIIAVSDRALSVLRGE